jgi:hypothetical protein
VQVENLFFDRVAHDESVDGDGTLLADAVGAVAGLILDRRIPPWIKVNNIIGGREIQPCAARPQTDQEQVALPRLESRDPLFPLPG